MHQRLLVKCDISLDVIGRVEWIRIGDLLEKRQLAGVENKQIQVSMVLFDNGASALAPFWIAYVSKNYVNYSPSLLDLGYQLIGRRGASAAGQVGDAIGRSQGSGDIGSQAAACSTDQSDSTSDRLFFRIGYNRLVGRQLGIALRESDVAFDLAVGYRTEVSGGNF